MANKNYRSANNRTIDMDTLRLKNEEVRAVGNMNVNARGDRLDNNNKTVDSRNRRVGRQYKKQTNVVDQPVADSIEEAKKYAELYQQQEPENSNNTKTTEKTADTVDETIHNENQEEPTDEPQGLAAAIARAREVKQEEVVPPRKASQQKPGVKKI